VSRPNVPSKMALEGLHHITAITADLPTTRGDRDLQFADPERLEHELDSAPDAPLRAGAADVPAERALLGLTPNAGPRSGVAGRS
jgi:hypothetical protein